MTPVQNERGTVLVVVTLMIVLLLIMVGMGLDTGHLAYVRSQGQPAVDAAALAAASAVPTGVPDTVYSRMAELNYVKGKNDGGNNYLDSPNNLIDAENVTLINYNAATGEITAASGTSSSSMGNGNGVRVALETSNLYGDSVGGAIESPLFLTPLFNLFGHTVNGTQNVSVKCRGGYSSDSGHAHSLPAANRRARDAQAAVVLRPTLIPTANSCKWTAAITGTIQITTGTTASFRIRAGPLSMSRQRTLRQSRHS